jgi:beta-lactamase class A
VVWVNPRHSGCRKYTSLIIAALLICLPLAACSSPDSESLVATPRATVTFAPSAATTTPSSTRPPTSADPSPTPATESSDTAPAEPTIDLDPEAFKAEVDALVGDLSGLVEVVVALPDGTTLSEINSYEPIEAASLYKLAIMVELYVQREMGDISFDEEIVLDPAYFAEEDSAFAEGDIGYAVSIETLLQTMITLSSNVAATALLARVGNENVNLTMASLGLSSTEIRWSPDSGDYPPLDDEEPIIEEPEAPTEEPTVEDDVPTEPAVDEVPTEDAGSTPHDRALLRVPATSKLFDPRADAALNVTTAADIAALYLMLVNGQIVSESVSQEMLVLLEDQQINDRLPAYLPEDTIVAHKTGNLDGLVHDAGVIFAPAGPVVVVVLTEDVDEWQAIDLIATVARLAYDAGS